MKLLEFKISLPDESYDKNNTAKNGHNDYGAEKHIFSKLSQISGTNSKKHNSKT